MKTFAKLALWGIIGTVGSLATFSALVNGTFCPIPAGLLLGCIWAGTVINTCQAVLSHK